MSLHTYYNPQIIRFVLFIPKIFEHQNSGSNNCLISLSLNKFERPYKRVDFVESTSYNKHYWPNSKWNQISLMYILKIFYVKIRKCANCGLYPSFMVLTGLISGRISLNASVMYTWNTTESTRIRIWKANCTCFKITQNVRILTFFRMRFFETCTTMQSVFTCFAVTIIH